MSYNPLLKTHSFKEGDVVRIISKSKTCEGSSCICFVGRRATIGSSAKRGCPLPVENLVDGRDKWCSGFNPENLELMEEEWDR
jgi:hypothetical protein